VRGAIVDDTRDSIPGARERAGGIVEVLPVGTPMVDGLGRVGLQPNQ
jgi:hypothetical protein